MGQVEQPAGLAHGLPRVPVWVGYSVFHENPYPCDGSTGSSRVQTPLKMTSTVGFLSSVHHSKQTALLIKCFYVFVIMPHQENGLWPQVLLKLPKATQVALGNQSHKARQVSLRDTCLWTWGLGSFESDLGGFGSDLGSFGR